MIIEERGRKGMETLSSFDTFNFHYLQIHTLKFPSLTFDYYQSNKSCGDFILLFYYHLLFFPLIRCTEFYQRISILIRYQFKKRRIVKNLTMMSKRDTESAWGSFHPLLKAHFVSSRKKEKREYDFQTGF